MIKTGFESRVKVQQVLENQLPEFILEESPKTLDFLKQYYISQEYQGGPTDISENLDQYLKLDNLTPEVVNGFTGLTTDITASSGIITVTSTKGFPSSYGLLKIDDEIITYTGTSATTFTGCIRGFSGITSYHKDLNYGELVFSTSNQASHVGLSTVQNLSSLFLKELYKKLKYTLTPGLEDINFVSDLNVGNFIKEARTLYESKGTDESFRILFNILFGETPKVIDLEQFLLKPSSATYVRREVVVAEAISGDPLNLAGQTIFKNTDSSSTASVSEVEIIRRSGKTYYKLFLFIGYDDAFPTVTGTFNITGNTKNIETVSVGSSVITVDSTIGFSTSGTIYSGNNIITYTNKSINQFFGCSGVTTQITTGSVIRSDEIYYGYENGDLENKVELRLTGVLSKFNPIEQNSPINPDEVISVKSVGEIIKNPQTNPSYKEIFANSWIYNTSSRYEIDTFSSGTISQVVLKSDIDKSSLKIGDYIEILNRDSQTVVASNLLVTQITGKQVTTSSSFTLNQSFNYDIRRKLKNASSSSVPLEFSPVTAEIQNVYNQDNEYMYVASNSLPSYQITKSIFSYNASGVAGLDEDSGLYSTITFNTPVSFLTGSEIYYTPSQSPISGLSEGVYFVELVSGSGNLQIRLYNSLSVIGTVNYVSFGSLTAGTHNFVLRTQKEKVLSPQKILRKFPLSFNMGDGQSDLTEPGSIGMLINGVEIISYKTNDKVYYGPLESVSVLNGGTGYDVINPPLLEFSSGSALIQPVISGSLETIYVDPQDFDVDVIVSVTLTGGNGSGASFQPIVDKRSREIEFDARQILDGGGVDTTFETITFTSNHNLINGQPVIYSPGNNPSIGIATFQGLDFDSGETLKSGSTYYAKYVNDRTIQLYQSLTDYNSGINTVGFTTIGTAGIQKFLTEPKNTLTQIKVINGGSGYTNRKLRVTSSGISTINDSISFINHGFKDGEIILYSNTGISTTVSTPISGLSTSNQYYVLKIDDDTFRLADAGVGATITSNYTRKNYVSLGSTGTGYHIFNYPPISLNVEYSAVGLGSTQSRGSIVATPIIRGKIIDTYVYNNGLDYGSSILNYQNKPTISIKNGKYAQLVPVVVNGQIRDVSIQYGGVEYYSTPDLRVAGIGTGAVLKPVITNNRITDVVIVNSGSGYSQDTTSISVVPSGMSVIFDPQIRSITLNNNFLYDDINDSAAISNEIIRSSYNNLQYAISGYSGLVQNAFGDTGASHSPIIGWAYDGNPIYGSYGYSDPKNKNSAIRRLTSGYSLDTNYISNRPSGFAPGFFIEDYKFTNSGDLDEYNGRFCITPEFPNGVYAYFATSIVDGNGNTVGSFPYFIGNRYRSKFIRENETLNQSFDFNNSSLIRNTFPYKVKDTYANNDFLLESNEFINQLSVVESVTKGKIDSYEIVDSGDNYKVGDSLIFDESTSGGGGLVAQVSRVNGKEIENLQTSILSYDDALFTWQDGGKIKIKVSPKHELENLDYVSISGFSTTLSDVNGFYQIGVTSYTSTLSRDIPAYSTTGIVTDIYVANIPNNISVGSSIGIGSETFSLLNIFEYENVLRVSRNTSGGIHTSTSVVYFTPDSFTVNKKTDYFESKDNDIVYFNPKKAVGVGTTSGLGISVNYNIGNRISSVYIPTQSLYLPNHPFKNNQEVILTKPGTASAISVANTSSSTAFDLPFSGNEQTVYVIKKSVDFIGITTQIGLTTTTNGLYFISNGSDDYQYSIRSNFSQIKGDIQRVTSIVSVSTSHQLNNGDEIQLTVKPNLSVGIGTSTSIKVLYDSNEDKLIINPVEFTSSGINTVANQITISNHGFKTGDKVIYKSTSVASGLSTGIYYVYKVDDNLVKLCQTYTDSISNPPLFVDINSAPAVTHRLLPINPNLDIVKNNNAVFDLSDTSLSGFRFKIFYDRQLKDEFISVGTTSIFSISGVGTAGVSTNASLTINYDSELPSSLFYGLEKSGVVNIPDSEVQNYSQINFIDSHYHNNYKIFGVSDTTFKISLPISPENYNYSKTECDELKYDTSSLTAFGGVSKIRTISPGSNFSKLPIFDGIGSTSGSGAYIIPQSNSIGKINNVRILNEGFEYSSDKTLRPEASIAKFLIIKDSNEIVDIDVSFGGRNYTFPPNLIVVNSVTDTRVDSGFLTPTIDGTAITSVTINQKPKGLPQLNSKIVAINNDNGVGIQTVQTSATGIVTCFLVTPFTGFVTEPFSVGDKIFVEGILKYGTEGDGFNSADYGYNFFTVSAYANSGTELPRVLEFNLGELKESVNPGIAQTITAGIYGTIVNYKNYPRFSVNQEFSNFILGESLQVSTTLGYVNSDLNITESNKNYIKVSGSYELLTNQTVRGTQSGTIATISEIKESVGQFEVNYSTPQNIGWSDDTGKLDEDIQVIPDNDYYQNLSYSIKSNQEWVDIVSPVNSLLHTSGLKNFSDTQIVKNVGIGITADQYADFVYNFVDENRVDTINNFDLVIDVDTDGNSSRFLKLKNRRLADYIECKTNRVLNIDDISSQFTETQTDFDLNYQGTPIFRKVFDPADSTAVNLSTGQFSILNHFFSTGEELIYTPGSTTPGFASTSVGIGSTLNSVGVVTNILPSTVYAIKIDNNNFKIATRKEYALANPAIAVTFTTVGAGNSHQFEMSKKNDKSIISINNIVQSPIAYSLLNYTLNSGGQIGTASTTFALSGISSITIGDILKIDNEYMKVISVGFGTSYSGPVSFAGTFPLVTVQRGFVGSSSTTHSDYSSVSLYRGTFDIVNSKIYFTDPPRGITTSQYYTNTFGLPEPTSVFNGRVFLRKDYTTNQVYDNVSERFTGIGQTYTLTVNGINTVGLGSTGGNGIVFINGIFQTPTTENNSQNNFTIVENNTLGISSIVFSGITSSNGSTYVSVDDVNINQLPRGGLIVSLGSTPGLGYAPLVGASVTAIIGVGGTIVSIGIGTTGSWGSGYRTPVTISISESGHTGTSATITSNVGAGGTLSFNITNAGTGYTNPTINVSPPSYNNLPVIGVSRLSIGATTDTGVGLLLNVDVGASSTTGIGSTLFEVTGFKVVRNGYGFKPGDVVKAVGLVTAYGLTQPVSEFELTILSTFTDSFSAWQFGQMDYIDSVKTYQNGSRTRFPLYYNSQLLSFEKNASDPDSQLIDFNTLLIIFINGILQQPGVAYEFNGGTSFTFTQPPKPEDNVAIFFYRGSSDDSTQVDVFETLKIGDSVQAFSNNNYLGITTTQEIRNIFDIPSADRIQTNNYFFQGINSQSDKQLNLSWIKQKVDKVIDGNTVSKARDSVESQVYPTARLISNLSTTDNQIFVDNVKFFSYDSPTEFDGLIVSGSTDPISAAVTATVSAAGTIQTLTINQSGSGYSGASVEVKISAPPSVGVGLGTTATATIAVVNGSLSSPVTILNPGFGYTTSNLPEVIVPLPDPVYENIKNITGVAGSFGNIIGITTATGIGTDLAIKFTLDPALAPFTDWTIGYPIYIFNTTVGNGVTSIVDHNESVIGVGTEFLDNIYHISAFNSSLGIMTCNIKSDSSVVGIATTGSTVGKVSWGRMYGFTRSSSPVAIAVSGYNVDSGLSTFPTIQRRGYGLRSIGPIKKVL